MASFDSGDGNILFDGGKTAVNQVKGEQKTLLAIRISMAFLWLLSGITSLFWGRGIGLDVLAAAGITGDCAIACLWTGSLLDIFLALWLLLGWRLRICMQLQIAVILVYSLLLKLIAAEFWLHPFGPVSKNIPLLVLLFIGSQLSRETG